MKLKKLYVFFGFFVVELVIILFFYLMLTRDRIRFYDEKLKELQQQITITLNIQKDISHILYDYINSDDELMQMLSKAMLTQTQDADDLRRKIYKRLKTFYERTREYHVRQVHFHTVKSDSFLRMHIPQRYGDSLVGVRYSVEETNRLKKAMHGFEEGRIYNGFRNVYPLFYHERHIGSVEISFAFEAIQMQLQRIFPSHYRFMVNKSVVDSKVFNDLQQSHYIKSDISDAYLFENRLQQKTLKGDGEMAQLIHRINEKLSDEVAQRIFEHRPFYESTRIGAKRYLVRYFPVTNLQDSNVAYVISYSLDEDSIDTFAYVTSFVMVNLLLLVVLFVFMMRRKNREHSFIQAILDTQEHIIVVSNGRRIRIVNKAFLEFYDVDSLQSFLKRHECICNTFIQNEAFFHVHNKQGSAEWLKELLGLEESLRVVSMQNRVSKRIHIFQVGIQQLDDLDYVVTFSDITEISKELKKSTYKATHDPLTGIYNRSYINQVIKDELSDVARREKESCILMFDIDFFKRINDTYGHLTGDYVLVTICKEVGHHLRRNNDVFARWGGEEFMILLPDTAFEEAQFIAEKLRLRIENIHFNDIKQVTCSFGVTTLHPLESQQLLTQRLDALMYDAKKRGRNRVVSKS